MNRSLLALAIAGAVASPALAAAPKLTVYSGDFDAVARGAGQPGGPGFALYDTRIEFDLQPGDNRVQRGGLPAALDASSVRLQPAGDATVRGQRFDFALADQDELLRRAIGQQVSVEQALGPGRETYTGTLLSAGNGLTLKLADGRVKVLSNYASFELPRLPEGVASEPTLSWTLAAPRAGKQAFDLSFATAGLAWRAEYQATLSGQGQACRMTLDGAAMVANRSGTDFDGVALTLVAGEPNRVSGGGYGVPMAAKSERAVMMVADAAPAPQASGEYHAYRLPGTGDLPQGSVQRLPLVDTAKGIACERRYETRSPMGSWQPPQPIIDANFNTQAGQQPVVASLRFANRKASGLGIPLPAGRMRLFDGADFLGEAALGHTAADTEVALETGTVFDLSAERRHEDFQLDRAGRQMTETVVITVRNAKAGAATVRVQEVLPRWTDWEITASSVPARKLDAQSVAFDLPVPAGGEADVRYTVRYRWAPDVRID